MTRREMLFTTSAAAVAGLANTSAAPNIVASWNFNAGSHGWLPGYTDYNIRNAFLDRLAEIRPLPPELARPNERGFYIQGMNRSDDLYMFLKNQIGPAHGVKANQWYWASMHIQVASNAPSGCFGVGGAPGEGVYLKAGVTTDEPVEMLTGGGDVRLSLDKGFQSEGGQQIELVSNIANGTPCELPVAERYVMLERVLFQDTPVQADPSGTLWISVGTDSAYEGLTALYYYTIGVVLQEYVAPPSMK